MKNLKNYIYIFCIMIVVLVVVICGSVSKYTDTADDAKITVALIENEGFSVVSQNPVVIDKGETVSFDIVINDNYFFSPSEGVEYKDGKLIFENVKSSGNIYYKMGQMCTVDLTDSLNGTVQLDGEHTVPEGEKVSVRIVPDEHYRIESIVVNDKEYPPISGEIFEFNVEEDCNIQVNFIGEPVNFMCMSNNLGTINISNQVDEYHYGEIINLDCEISGSIEFKGWSIGGYIDDGGEVIGGESRLDYTITEDTILYANFKDLSVSSIKFEGNNGIILENIDMESSPNVYINLPVDNGKIKREGYTLVGYNTKYDGTGESYQLGEMLIVPENDMVLYAMWAKNTEDAYFNYSIFNDTVTINGVANKNNLETEVCIPSTFNGKKVVAIADNAFKGMNTLEKVIIPIGVERIGKNAFAGCKNLTTVYLPETLTYMADNSFSDCNKFTQLRILPSLGRAFDYDYDSVLADKYMRLKYSEGKRIILVGGSNLTFGINSVMLKERFNSYDIVNFSGSYHYGIITPFELIKANVREGDIVIFIPEYHNTTYGECESSMITNWQYIESNYAMLEDINIQNTPVLLQQFTKYLDRKRAILPGKLKNSDSVYVRSGINGYGDLMVYRKHRTGLDIALPNKKIVTAAGMDRYNNVCKELTEKGVECLFSFPSIHGGDEYRDYIENQTKEFMTLLKDKLNPEYCTIISKCSDFSFDVKLFYDNKYHLTLEGAKERTKVLIRDLEKYGIK